MVLKVERATILDLLLFQYLEPAWNIYYVERNILQYKNKPITQGQMRRRLSNRLLDLCRFSNGFSYFDNPFHQGRFSLGGYNYKAGFSKKIFF